VLGAAGCGSSSGGSAAPDVSTSPTVSTTPSAGAACADLRETLNETQQALTSSSTVAEKRAAISSARTQLAADAAQVKGQLKADLEQLSTSLSALSDALGERDVVKLRDAANSMLTSFEGAVKVCEEQS
jgi:hypothetical protein